ncbi:Thiol-disulfide oxidoreductase ResA [Terrisporobacter petrolearius]|uniref:TlpA disulfide reductase family protein n=1 Tax=Terrisporobacter petrolearius TaxID=1460447 RepID=UPI003365E5AD
MKNKTSKYVIGLAIITLVGFVGIKGYLFFNPSVQILGIKSPQANNASKRMNQMLNGVDLSGFNTKDVLGEKVTSDIFSKYKVTMINVWATDCASCVEEMPEINKLSKNKQANTNVITLCTDTAWKDEAIEFAKQIVDKNKSVKVLIPDKVLQKSLANKIVAYPTTIFVDSKGKIIQDVYLGGKTEEDYLKELNKRLKTLE